MKNNKALDNIDKLKKVNTYSYIDKIIVDGQNDIEFSKPITILCGLNGAGKTIIMKTLYNAFKEYDFSEINGFKCKSIKIYDGKTKTNREINKNENNIVVEYFEAKDCEKTREYFFDQQNVQDFFEECTYEFSEEDVKKINYLVGKNYKSCKVYDVREQCENLKFPYLFEVLSEDGVKYNSLTMGTGEHIIIMIFYILIDINKQLLIDKNKIIFVLIEELETYISIRSQMCLINQILEIITENKNGNRINERCNFIISTHSKYVIDIIPPSYIRYVSYSGGKLCSKKYDEKTKIISLLGIEEKQKEDIIFLVEDEMAKEYLDALLEEIDSYKINIYKKIIKPCGGDGKIQKELNHYQNKEKHCIGIYDADLKDNEEFKNIPNTTFLPGNDNLENDIIYFLKNSNNYNRFIKELNLEEDENFIKDLIDACNGIDEHDAFKKIINSLNITQREVIKKYIELSDIDITSFQNKIEKLLKIMIKQ